MTEKNSSVSFTPLGLDKAGVENKVGADLGVYIRDMKTIFSKALADYRIRKPVMKGRDAWCLIKKRKIGASDAEAFDSTDPMMGKWLTTHTMLVAEFKRKVFSSGIEQTETVLIAYTSKERQFVILRSFRVDCVDFAIGCYPLADEFWVEKNKKSFLIHPFKLKWNGDDGGRDEESENGHASIK